METALYYTLSTIAQTLAGALAILVAVILFRLSALKQTIDENRQVSAMRNIDVSLLGPSRARSVSPSRCVGLT
jgi:hypothetical protein